MTSPAWRFLVNADRQALDSLRDELGIPADLLDHALDPGERPRLRTTPSVTFILLRVPAVREQAASVAPQASTTVTRRFGIGTRGIST